MTKPTTPTGKRLAEHFPEEGLHTALAAIEAEAKAQGAAEEREQLPEPFDRILADPEDEA